MKPEQVIEFLRGKVELSAQDATDAFYTAAAIIEQCAARGFLDDAGNVRKAIEADVGLRRHMTDDGAIVLCPSASVYAFERTGDGRFTGRIQKMVYRNWFHCKFDDDMPAQWEQNAPDGKWGCYSSMESAASAMKERGA